MGIHLNPGNIDFQQALNSKIYVDKTMLIAYTNSVICTEQKYMCVSRPRRFGKSMAVNMLAAYYSKGCDSKEVFGKFKIAEADTFEKHLNKYNVIRLNMVNFMERSKTVNEMTELISKRLIHELKKEYGYVDCFDWDDLLTVLEEVFYATNIPFVFIIDEWDCVMRRYQKDEQPQKDYLNFLKTLLKDQSYIALAYMTGILPIKKYGEHSAINMFYEHSMTYAEPITEFTGFTENEVEQLCVQHSMSFDEMKHWYNGYNVDGMAIYNPKSVVEAIVRGGFNNYWTSTETYEALKVHIVRNFDGLKDKVVRLIAGEKVRINTEKFQNDMDSLESTDDVFTLLVHLGYLTYGFDSKTVWIPNSEVRQEFVNSIEDGGWEEVMNAINQSEKLLKATLKCEEEKVAEMVETVHRNNASIIQYNDENSLSCVLSLAYYSAQKNYSVYREMAGGEGYADLVFVPRRNCSDQAIIVELKWDKSVETAIMQIKEKKYVESLKDYSGEVLLVGISYEKEKSENQKKHTCKIERITI